MISIANFSWQAKPFPEIEARDPPFPIPGEGHSAPSRSFLSHPLTALPVLRSGIFPVKRAGLEAFGVRFPAHRFD